MKMISKSFKVMYFKIIEKLIRHFLTPRNNTGFNFKPSKKVAT